MARVSARVIFVCRVVLGETLFSRLAGEEAYGTNPFSHSLSAAPASPKGTPLAKRAGLVLIRQRQEEASVKLQTFRLCQSLSLSGEVARRSRDGEGFSRALQLLSVSIFPNRSRGKIGKASVP